MHSGLSHLRTDVDLANNQRLNCVKSCVPSHVLTYIYIYMCLSACNRNFRICMYISYIHMYISRLHVPSYNKMFSYVYTHVICILKLSHSKMELTENRWNVKLCTSTHVYNWKSRIFVYLCLTFSCAPKLYYTLR